MKLVVAATVAAIAASFIVPSRAQYVEGSCGPLFSFPLRHPSPHFPANSTSHPRLPPAGSNADAALSRNGLSEERRHCSSVRDGAVRVPILKRGNNHSNFDQRGTSPSIPADAGAFSGTGEDTYYVKNCEDYSGTSGWSASVGGIISNGTCDQGLPNPDIKPTRIGDVCVATNAINWDCRLASFNQTAGGYPDQCSVPKESSTIDQSYLFGKCFWNNFTKAHTDFADAIVGAAKGIGATSFPKRSNSTVKHETEYWSLLNKALNQTLVTVKPDDKPTVWDYKTCIESDSQ
ncbi:hypothetical protein HDU93_009514, partial [Gonapodya sp. JEL0774]